uniref:Uncharacterized protein n=1 Tax=Naja naja TaxID=35670 RepID=A0A8C6Y400_NAJNA
LELGKKEGRNVLCCAARLDKTAVLVTGSNRGLGLELVRQLAGRSNPPKGSLPFAGTQLDPVPQDLKNLAAEHPQIVIITLDTNDPCSVKAAAAKVTELLKGAGLNLLVNNAGILKLSTVETETPENMSEVYKTNVIGPMIVSQAFLPLLREASQKSPQKGMSCSKAAILNITSECGSMTNLFAWHMNELISYRCSKVRTSWRKRAFVIINVKGKNFNFTFSYRQCWTYEHHRARVGFHWFRPVQANRLL